VRLECRMDRLHTSIAGLIAFLLCLSGCASQAALHTSRPPSVSFESVSTSLPSALIVEPDDGMRPLIRAIDKSQNTIFVETYILTDSRIVHALERAETQGVDVRVLLEHHPIGMGVQPETMRNTLLAAGIDVRWTSSTFLLTHAKFAVLDDKVAVISTANFSRSAFSHNREFLIMTRRPIEVREISNLFRRDWDRMPERLQDRALVVSPVNARSSLGEFLRTASRSIDIYAEEISDTGIERHLIAKAMHGVAVRVILEKGASPAAASYLRQGHVLVRQLGVPYIHAKLIVIDGREAYVGSVNLSAASLDGNRELGILISGKTVHRLIRTYDRDWKKAAA
jgi:cardiolipin synthase A/B